MTPAQQFLRELEQALPWGRRRRLLAEVRQHLEEDVRAELAQGSSAEEAEAAVVARLGTPGALAAGMPRIRWRPAAVAAGLAILVGAGILALFSVRATHHAPANGRPAAANVALEFPPARVHVGHLVVHSNGGGVVYLTPMVQAQNYVQGNS